MTKFIIGDRVRENATGDVGTITRPHEGSILDDDGSSSWWVKWESGLERGKELHLKEYSMELFDGPGNGQVEILTKMIEELAKRVEELERRTSLY